MSIQGFPSRHRSPSRPRRDGELGKAQGTDAVQTASGIVVAPGVAVETEVPSRRIGSTTEPLLITQCLRPPTITRIARSGVVGSGKGSLGFGQPVFIGRVAFRGVLPQRETMRELERPGTPGGRSLDSDPRPHPPPRGVLSPRNAPPCAVPGVGRGASHSEGEAMSFRREPRKQIGQAVLGNSDRVFKAARRDWCLI